MLIEIYNNILKSDIEKMDKKEKPSLLICKIIEIKQNNYSFYSDLCSYYFSSNNLQINEKYFNEVINKLYYYIKSKYDNITINDEILNEIFADYGYLILQNNSYIPNKIYENIIYIYLENYDIDILKKYPAISILVLKYDLNIINKLENIKLTNIEALMIKSDINDYEIYSLIKIINNMPHLENLYLYGKHKCSQKIFEELYEILKNKSLNTLILQNLISHSSNYSYLDKILSLNIKQLSLNGNNFSLEINNLILYNCQIKNIQYIDYNYEI